jgi:heat-inducible transcriptional repressor
MSQEIDIMTPRRQQILGIVVRKYVEAAAPVSSKAVSSVSELNVSSATVRNEMAYLEDHGYLTHPHTSAGRIPTEKGYRYFVEQLMVDVPLLIDERRMIEHQFHQAQLDLNQWMRLAATVMAHASRAAAIVAPPQIHRCRFKHLELISTHGPLVLLVLVLEEGMIRQQVLSMERPRSQEDLSRVSRWLNDVFAGLYADDIRQQFAALPVFEVQVGGLVAEMMEWVDHNSGPVYRDGLVHVLSEPEFEQNAGQVAQVFSDGGPLDVLLWDMLSMAAERGSVQVLIGGEGQRSELSDFGLVLSHYGINGYATGALGVLGPVRMPYARAVSVVRFMSRLLSDLIQQLYGDQLPPAGPAEDRPIM